jgi:YbbR domain-containing protein
MKLPKFLRNTDIRLASLLLAVMLWFHAVTEKEYRVTLRCPVEVKNVPSGWMVLGRPLGANYAVTATGKEIIALRFSPPVITVDVANRQVKRLTVDLDPARLKYPFGITPRQVEFMANPLVVSLDRRTSKQVRIVADIRGESAEGYLVGDSVAVVPPAVDVRGPQKLLEGLDSLYTQPLDINGKSALLEIAIRVALPDTALFSAAPESVMVKVPFEKAGERLFRNIPIGLINRGTGYLVSISPGTVDVVVAGPQLVLAATKASDLKAVLDLKHLDRGRYQLQASIELPAKLELLAASPRDFDVNIR